MWECQANTLKEKHKFESICLQHLSIKVVFIMGLKHDFHLATFLWGRISTATCSAGPDQDESKVCVHNLKPLFSTCMVLNAV